MDELQARHRKEQRDLQSRMTQKKKQASKKTRKGINDECERLEAELHQRHQTELAALQHGGDGAPPEQQDEALSADQLQRLTLQVDDDESNDNDDNAHVHNDLPSNHEKDWNGASNPATSTAAAAATTAPSPPPQIQTRKPNRQKARLARRAADQAELVAQASVEADALPDRKAQERSRILAAMSARNLHEIEIRADGHCLYSAVADQLTVLGIPLSPSGPLSTSLPSSLPFSSPSISTPTFAAAKTVPPVSSDAFSPSPSQPTMPAYKVLRATTADYMLTHPDEFAPFLDEPLAPYAAKIRDTAEWGGQLELLALARAYGADIHVLQDFGRIERIAATAEGEERKGDSASTVAEAGTPPELWLGYYKHGFGLGEHYNSLRKEN